MREYFPSLYGNMRAKTRLGDAIAASRLPHALMLSGPEGSGRMTLARNIAMAVACENRFNSEQTLPCGRCNTCRRIHEGNFTDITYIKREGDKATIGVDEVRRYREDMMLSANESDFKIYIIEEADRLTENAQNAMLTVLEEPPRSVIIILLCESEDKILTTIKSRVQTVRMERFEPDELGRAVLRLSEGARGYSEKDPAAFDGILMSADGRIGRATELFDEHEAKKSNGDRDTVGRIMTAICKGLPYKDLYAALSELPRSRAEFSAALETLVCATRDLTLLKLDKKAPLLFYTKRDEALAAAKEISTQKLLSVYESVRSAISDVGRNVGISGVTADLAAKIKLL